jgi:hypothetical protein
MCILWIAFNYFDLINFNSIKIGSKVIIVQDFRSG